MGSGDFLRVGLWFLAIAACCILIGVLLSAGGRYLSWFGRLPGDIRIDGKNFAIRIPLASSILVSLVLTVIANLLRRR